MADTIRAELFSATLFELLDETFSEVHGIYLDGGTSLFETLEGISAATASVPVSESCASLAAQVAHVTFYLDVLERYLVTGEPVRADWGEIWRTVRAVTPEEWSARCGQLRQSHARVLATLQDVPTWDDERALGSALAILVHTAYHLGEIRQALCTRP